MTFDYISAMSSSVRKPFCSCLSSISTPSASSCASMSTPCVVSWSSNSFRSSVNYWFISISSSMVSGNSFPLKSTFRFSIFAPTIMYIPSVRYFFYSLSSAACSTVAKFSRPRLISSYIASIFTFASGLERLITLTLCSSELSSSTF